MTDKTLLERLDDSVRWTAIPALSERGVKRRHHRWLPFVALALATAGLGMAVIRPSLYWSGYALLIAGTLLGNLMPMIGPIAPPLALDAVDERQRSQRRDAYLWTCAAISIVAFVGLFSLAAIAVLQNWTVVMLARVMAMLALYLLALMSTLPTLHASWSSEPIDDD